MSSYELDIHQNALLNSDNTTDLWHKAYTLVAGYCLVASWNKKHMKYDFNNRNTCLTPVKNLIYPLVPTCFLHDLADASEQQSCPSLFADWQEPTTQRQKWHKCL